MSRQGGGFSSLLIILVAIVGIVVFTMFIFVSQQDATYDARNMEEEISIAEEDAPDVPDTSNIETGTWSIQEMVDNIRGGGVSKDGIPAIENSSYVAVDEVDFLEGSDQVFITELDGEIKIYPQIILVRHEIVNEQDSDGPVSITYCPLVGTAIGYRGSFEKVDTTFGVSGNLLNSNLVMYDRETESLWPQILGQSITGDAVGETLETFEVWWSTWALASEMYPDAQVLSKNTGYLRSYKSDPYGSYLEDDSYYTSGEPLFPVMNEDDLFDYKEVMVGIKNGTDYLAIQKSLIESEGTVETLVGDLEIVAVWDDELQTARVFQKEEDGELGGWVTSFDVMWFAWVAFYPDAAVYAGIEIDEADLGVSADPIE